MLWTTTGGFSVILADVLFANKSVKVNADLQVQA